MSVNTNTILGEIPSGTDCFLIGRHTSGANVVYTVFVTDPSNYQGMLSVGATLPVAFGATGGYTVVTPTMSSAGIVKFTTKTLGNGLTATPTTLNTGYLSSQVSGVDNVAYWSPSSANQVGFKLTPQGNNVPKTKIYSGVWYQLALAASGAAVNEALFTPAALVSGWSGEPAAYANPTVSTSMDIAFIPRSAIASVYNAGSCTAVINEWDLFTRFDLWVRHAYMGGANTYEQSNCTGPLGATSTNCLFVGTGCNNLVGYTYCTNYQTCADGCFGICNNGKACTYDAILAKWFCPTDCASSRSSSMDSSSDTCSSRSRRRRSSSCRRIRGWMNSTWFLLILAVILLIVAVMVGRYLLM